MNLLSAPWTEDVCQRWSYVETQSPKEGKDSHGKDELIAFKKTSKRFVI